MTRPIWPPDQCCLLARATSLQFYDISAMPDRFGIWPSGVKKVPKSSAFGHPDCPPTCRLRTTLWTSGRQSLRPFARPLLTHPCSLISPKAAHAQALRWHTIMADARRGGTDQAAVPRQGCRRYSRSQIGTTNTLPQNAARYAHSWYGPSLGATGTNQ